MDAKTTSPRELMQALLPEARSQYVKAWELLADGSVPLPRRRVARERAGLLAADHLVIAAALRERERSLSGDDLLNARHLADELERHAAALERLRTLSPHAVACAADLRPDQLGCGRRYRDPSRTRGATPTRARPPRADARGAGRRHG